MVRGYSSQALTTTRLLKNLTGLFLCYMFEICFAIFSNKQYVKHDLQLDILNTVLALQLFQAKQTVVCEI